MDAEPLASALRTNGWTGGYRAALLDAGYAGSRREYVDTLLHGLRDVGGWLALDSFFGGGDRPDDSASVTEPHDRGRYQGFRASAVVCQMAAELGSGASILLSAAHRYAAAGLVRQIVECEYLLVLFAEDFKQATAWSSAQPSDIRANFQPKKLRKLGGFSDIEYWNHCDIGGHPSPKGIYLLDLESRMPRIADQSDSGASDDRSELATEEMRLDLLFHLDRVWRAEVALLTKEHARFKSVRSSSIEAVADARGRWADTDPMAQPEVFEAIVDGFKAEQQA